MIGARLQRRAIVDTGLAVVLAVAVWVLYWPALRLWWLYDDAFHLRQISGNGFATIFASPAFWRALPNPVFTPLLFASWKLDFALFGANPLPFYIHHLTALAIATVVFYAVLRLWLEPAWTFGAALLVMVGPPMAEIAQQMFHRHYIEGLMLAIAAAGLFILSLRRESAALSIAAAGMYLAAMAAKEVYVPLIAVLATIPERSIRDRIRHLIPFAVALSVYVAWRTLLLGLKFTGYGWAVAPEQRWQVIGTLPWRAAVKLSGSEPLSRVALLMLIAVALILLLRVQKARPIALVAVLAALVPIIPVSFVIEARYVVVAWLFVAVAVTFAARTMRGGSVLLIGSLVTAFIANRAEWTSTYAASERMAKEAKALGTLTRNDVLLRPAIPPAAIAELRWLYPSLLGDSEIGSWLYDDLPLCRDLRTDRVFLYDGDIVRPAPPGVIQSLCRKIADRPLQARFDYRHDALWWQLGPSDRGGYSIVLDDGAQAFAVPREGGFRLSGPASLRLRVRYESPEGWMTYSPQMSVPLEEGAHVAWRR